MFQSYLIYILNNLLVMREEMKCEVRINVSERVSVKIGKLINFKIKVK